MKIIYDEQNQLDSIFVSPRDIANIHWAIAVAAGSLAKGFEPYSDLLSMVQILDRLRDTTINWQLSPVKEEGA